MSNTSSNFKYGLSKKDEDNVIIDYDKFINVIYKKGMTKVDVCKSIGVGTTYLNDVHRRKNKCNVRVFNAACKFLHIKPSFYITDDLTSNKEKPKKEEKKVPVKKPVTKKAAPKKEVKKEAPIVHKDPDKPGKDEIVITGREKPFIDTPLVVTLKSKNEFDELIEVQREIRDALRELVNELKTPTIPKPTTIDLRPKAYLAKEEDKK